MRQWWREPEETTLAALAGAENALSSASASARLDAYGANVISARLLAINWREVVQAHPHAVVDDEAALTFAGFAAFLDPPKDDAAESLAALAASGVEVKVITGDNERVTQYVCAALGIEVRGVLLGAQIAAMDDRALAAKAGSITLFCRVTPAQKSRLVTLLRRRGHVVGFLSDGINDAPALHAANAGVSVDGAVDVAKEAAYVGFVAPPLEYFLILGAMVVCYLLLVECVKRWFYRRAAAGGG